MIYNENVYQSRFIVTVDRFWRVPLQAMTTLHYPLSLEGIVWPRGSHVHGPSLYYWYFLFFSMFVIFNTFFFDLDWKQHFNFDCTCLGLLLLESCRIYFYLFNLWEKRHIFYRFTYSVVFSVLHPSYPSFSAPTSPPDLNKD